MFLHPEFPERTVRVDFEDRHSKDISVPVHTILPGNLLTWESVELSGRSLNSFTCNRIRLAFIRLPYVFQQTHSWGEYIVCVYANSSRPCFLPNFPSGDVQ